MYTTQMLARPLTVGLAVVCSMVAQALTNGQDWTGNGEDTLASTQANWHNGRAEDSTAPMRWDGTPDKTVTFDRAYEITDYLWVGTTTAGRYFAPATETSEEVFRPVVWQATDPTNGVHQTRNSFRFADAGSQNSALQIESGTYTTDAEIWIGTGGGTAKVVVNGGLLSSRGDFIMSNNSGGASRLVVGSGDATRSAKVTVPVDRWAKLTAADYGSGHLALRAGGEFHCGFLQMNAADSQVIFDGGTFVKDGDVSNTTGSLFGRNSGQNMFLVNEGSHLQVTENGGTLDIGNFATRIDMPIVLAAGAGSGTLVTKGASRLTLNGADGFGGTLHVTEGGVLQLKAGATIGGLEIEPGAFLVLASETFPEPGATLLTVSSDISALAGRIVINGLKTVISESDGKWIVRGEAYGEGEDPTPTYVIPEGVSFAIEKDYTWALAANWVVDGTLTIRSDAHFAGNLSGQGRVEVVTVGGDVYFTGDNEAFAGTVVKANKEALHFDSVTAGSPLARWNLGGDIRSNVPSGTLKFGQIDYHIKDGWSYWYAENATSDRYVIEIGALNEDSNLGTSENICNIGGNQNFVTIRKVGTGNLDMWFDKYDTIDLHEGTVTFQNNNGPYTTYMFTGGAMRLAYIPGWDFLNRIKNSTGPVTIDTNGESYGLYQKGTINNTNVGGFKKLGEGQLTIWGDTAYTGPTTVEAGTLFIKGKRTDIPLGGGTVTVAEGAQLILTVDHLAPVDGEPLVILEGAVDAESASRILASGLDKTITIDAGENVAMTTAPGEGPNRWVGQPIDNWTTSANWSRGLPKAGQSIQVDYTARIANIQGTIDLDKIIVAAGAEAQFVTRNYNTHPSLNVNAIEILGEGEATIALDHCGIQSRVGRYDTPVNLNFRIVSTTTDSWLRDLNLKGKLLGDGMLRPYSVYFYGDNSAFNGTILVQDDGSHICDVAASATNAVWSLQHDIHFDILEGTFKMGELDCRNMRVWYSALGSTATIEVGHKNTDFGGESSQYFFGPDGYNDNEVPPLTFRKVGTGTWIYYGKGIRNIEVAEGTLELHPYAGTAAETKKFDNHKGKQIETLVVRTGATLSGTAGDQPIYALTLEEGSVVREELAWDTVTEGETVTTNGLKCVATLNVSGDVLVSNATFVAANPEILPAATKELGDSSADWTAKPTFLTATGTLTGEPTAETTAWPVDGRNEAGYQPVGSTKGWGWLVKRSGMSVRLACRKAHPGLIVFIQ